MIRIIVACLLIVACAAAQAIDLNHTVTIKSEDKQKTDNLQLTPEQALRLRCVELMAPLAAAVFQPTNPNFRETIFMNGDTSGDVKTMQTLYVDCENFVVYRRCDEKNGYCTKLPDK